MSAEIEKASLPVVQGDEYVQHESQPSRSHTCCGCCCDTRMAVIVVDLVSISFAFLEILALSALASLSRSSASQIPDDFYDQFDDDEVKAMYQEMAVDEVAGIPIWVAIVLAVIHLLCNASGIFGAYKFRKIAVLVASVWYGLECIRALVYLDLVALVMAAFFLYPHIVFYREVSSGIMSPITYPNEKRCCDCCV